MLFLYNNEFTGEKFTFIYAGEYRTYHLSSQITGTIHKSVECDIGFIVNDYCDGTYKCEVPVIDCNIWTIIHWNFVVVLDNEDDVAGYLI